MNVINEVAAERERQKSVEGWTLEHDDEHGMGQMAKAAAAYAYFGSLDDSQRTKGGDADSYTHFLITRLFPVWGTSYGGWGWHWWKPKDQRRDLIRAAALIVAEIERLDRAADRASLSAEQPNIGNVTDALTTGGRQEQPDGSFRK